MVYRESTVVFLFAILGLFMILLSIHEYRYFSILVVSWVTVLSFLLYLPLKFYYIGAYRTYILYPLGILQGIAIHSISEKVGLRFTQCFMRTRSKLLSPSFVKMLTSASLILLVLTTVLPNAMIHEYVYRPDPVTMAQIRRMSELFGFENTSNIYLIFNSPAKPLDPASSPHVVGWTRAYLGDIIYEGHLLELLNGQPDIRGRIYDLDGKTVVIGDRLYYMTSLELSLCEEVAEGVYILRPRNYSFEILENLLLSNYRLFSDFNVSPQNWHIITRTLKVDLNYLNENGSLSLLISVHKGSRGWFTIEKYFKPGLDPSMFQSVIIVFESFSVMNATLLLEVYYENGAVRGRRIHDVFGKYFLIAPILRESGHIVKIRFAIWAETPLPSSATVALRYMVLI